ncbi:hypothetical protein VNO78_22976 [Psophocarpus tetragonolobus]|uniref:Uncharacterized protein n=1 Tax=Psophocarpus tetragonolobus TaxID=3891 RepID=A0AAN9XCN1_PSOTE
MGLEILDEFRPIKAIRTVVPTVRSFSQRTEVEVETSWKEEQECHTPTSKPQNLLVCPPAPKKPRVSKRTTTTSFPSQPFFQVPHDLASIFLLPATPSALTTTSQQPPC